MKGVVFLGDRKLELREFPDPTPGPRDVILEIKASGASAQVRRRPAAPYWPHPTAAGVSLVTAPAAHEQKLSKIVIRITAACSKPT